MDDVTRVTTGEVRMSYVHLFKPYSNEPGKEEKYQVTVLVPKTDVNTMARINAAIEAAKQKGINDKWGGVCPPIVLMPVYDGDGARPSDGTPYGPECKGHWVLNAGAPADCPPEIVDKAGNPIINQSEVYSGMYGRVNLSFYAYAFVGKKGVGCGRGLGPVQKLRDGEPLASSAPSAAQAFGAPAPQAAAPQYGAPTGAVGYAPQPPYGQPANYSAPQQPAAVNPITGMPY